MKLAVNGRRLDGQRLGVARYIEYLLKHWAQQTEPDDDVVVYLRRAAGAVGTPVPTPFRTRVLTPALKGVAWENVLLPRAARGADVLFCPSYTAPLATRTPSVVAIHSMNEVESGTHSRWYRYTYTPLYRQSARRAARVIAPSQSTLEDLAAHYDIPREKLVVVPLGHDDAFCPLADDALVRATRTRYLGDDRPYILFVGKLSQRRNAPLLIEAFADAKKRAGLPHSLLLFGPNHLDLPLRETAERCGVADSVTQVDGEVASHDELAAVYRAADLFVSASSYEGFSLPLVEALACGLPAVITDRGAMPEIAGDAAVIIDAPEREALAAAIERVLTDDALRHDLALRGPERARSFRWDETARKTLDVLREVAQT